MDSVIEVDCCIDTGCETGVVLPDRYRKLYKTVPRFFLKFELADGSSLQYPAFKTKIKFDSILKSCTLVFTNISSPLVGMEFPDNCILQMDLKRKLISLT